MKEEMLFAISMLVFIIILLSVGFIGGFKSGYVDGQADARRGIYKYELVEKSDGSTGWEKIEKEKVK